LSTECSRATPDSFLRTPPPGRKFRRCQREATNPKRSASPSRCRRSWRRRSKTSAPRMASKAAPRRYANWSKPPSKPAAKHVVVADEPARAAGVILRSPSGRVLLMRRVDDGTWSWPGGWLESDETPEQGAWRQFLEETGHKLSDAGRLLMRSAKHGADERAPLPATPEASALTRIAGLSLERQRCLLEEIARQIRKGVARLDQIAADHTVGVARSRTGGGEGRGGWVETVGLLRRI
jgi:hypothetical protein